MIESWNPVEPDDLHALLAALRLDLAEVLGELDATSDHGTHSLGSGGSGRRRRMERVGAA